jgi:hypothetical protein
MTGSDEDLRRGRRPSAEDRGRSSKGRVLDCWPIGGGGRVMPCVVCTMHEETRSMSFLV